MSNLSRLAMTLGLKFGPVRKGVTPRKVLEYVVNEMVMVQADNQLAQDPDVIARFNGMMEGYRDVAHFIAPYTNITSKSRAARATARATKTAANAAKASAR